MDTLIAVGIVILAAAVLTYGLRRKSRAEGGCGGCCSCGEARETDKDDQP